MPLPQDPKAIVKRYRRKWDADGNWRALWQEITTFMSQRKSVVTVLRSPGSKRVQGQLVYDGTAQDGAITLASHMHGALSSSTSPWFQLAPDPPELMEDDDVKSFFSRASRWCFRQLASSNFDGEIQEAYLDLVTIGTGTVISEDFLDPFAPGQLGGFNFMCVTPGRYTIGEDSRGTVNELMHEVDGTIHSWAEKFGEAALPQRWRERYKKDPDQPMVVLHTAFPRTGVPPVARPGTRAKKLPYASLWIDLETEEPLSEGGYHEFPFAVGRWSKQSGELWGRGPGEIALPDTKTLNEGVKLRLQGWGLAVRPPMTARHRGVIGRVSIRPASVNIVRNPDDLKVMDFGSRFDVANFNEEQYRAALRGYFFNDKLQLPDKSIITATEANQRIRMMQRVLGPALGRIDNELLRRIVLRVFRTGLRAGVLGPIPERLLQAARGNVMNIQVTFVGPLARAQRAQQLEAAAEFVNAVIPLAPIFPDLIDNIDSDLYVQRAAEAALPWPDVIRTPVAVKKRRKARNDAAEQAAQREQLLQGAEALGKAAPAVQAMRDMQGDFDTPIGAEE